MNSMEMSDAELDDFIVHMVQHSPDPQLPAPEDFHYSDTNIFRSFDSTALINLYFSFECTFNPITDEFDFGEFGDWDKLGASASVIWTLAEGFHMTHQLLTDLESLIAELTEVDAIFHEKTDLLLLLWIRRPASVEEALVGTFPDIVRHYLTSRLFSLNNASGEVCSKIGKHVILPVFRFLNRRPQLAQDANALMVKSVFTVCNETKAKASLGYDFSPESETLLYAVVAECLTMCVVNLEDDATRNFLRRLIGELFQSSRPSKLDANGNHPAVELIAPTAGGSESTPAERLRLEKIRLILAIIKTEPKLSKRSAFILSVLMEHDAFGKPSEVHSTLEWMLFCAEALRVCQSITAVDDTDSTPIEKT